MVDVDILQLQEEALDNELENLYDALAEVNREIDLYEEDYMEDLQLQKESLEAQIRKVKKSLQNIIDYDEF